MNKPIFKSATLKEVGLPLGTPLNKYQPEWPESHGGKKAPEADKGMLTGQRCRCPSCGLYFNSTFAFDRHRVGRVGAPERRCLTRVELHSSRWTQGPKGHWLTPRKGAGSQAHRWTGPAEWYQRAME